MQRRSFTSFRPDDDLLFKDLKIVLVEDEEELAQLYKARFEKLGALVKTMGDFEQASYYIANKKNRIDLFITDICIINGTGEDLLKILNKLRPKVPSIVMTGSVSPNVELLYSLGVTNVLEKPFPFERIYYSVIQTILPLQMKWSRSQPRVKSQSSIQIFNKDESNYLKTANIGLGGMFVELENPNFKVNEDVEFELMLEVSAKKLIKFSGTAKVKWIRVKAEKNLKPGIGLEFVYIPENIRNELLNLIKSKQNSVYIPKTA